MKTRKRKIKIQEKKLGREKAYGMCYEGKNEIIVDPRQDSKEYMNTVIHESLHVLFPDWSETKVIKISNTLTNTLWECDYRKILK